MQLTHSVLITNSLSSPAVDLQSYERLLPTLLQEDAEVWAALNPKLTGTSNVGCPLSMTPPKYWSDDIAREYFGNKKVFGILRDPYERLVAFFRGSVGDAYAGDFSKWLPTCDVNGAVNHMMKEYLRERDTNPFIHGCTFLPQSEYFEGEFGIKIPVDNRRFPTSANELFAEHGYSNIRINTADCLHVNGCNEVWSA